MVVEDFVFGEGGHAVVAFAEEAGVGRVRDEGQKPFARAVVGEVGRRGVLVRHVKLVAFGAAHGLAGNERFASAMTAVSRRSASCWDLSAASPDSAAMIFWSCV